MSVSIRDSALELLRAYLVDFLANTPAMTANHGLISPWSDGLLDLALQAVRAGDLQRAADVLEKASAKTLEPVPVLCGDTASHIEYTMQERERIAIAVTVAYALLALATSP